MKGMTIVGSNRIGTCWRVMAVNRRGMTYFHKSFIKILPQYDPEPYWVGTEPFIHQQLELP